MKKKSGIILLIAVALVLTFVLAGCTETYKWNAVPGDYSDVSIVSESGLVTEVKAGDKYYLYFVNGVAGQTLENNEFGAVVKGAIARVELDGKDGNPILSTKTVVVPKNVFATEVDSSFSIRGGYIYYTTPNIIKDKDGKAKTSEMVIMRTTLDGTKTEIIKTFSAEDGGFSNLYRVTENEIVYYYQNKIFRIDLKNNNFEMTTLAEEVAAHKFVVGADYILYTKANEVKEEYSNRVMLLPFSAAAIEGEDVKDSKDARVLINKASYGNAANLTHPDGYTITLTAAYKKGDKLDLFYTKTDSATEPLSVGIYRYTFDIANGFQDGKYQFVAAAEQRITAKGGKAYTAFDFIDENSMYATDANGIFFLVKEKHELEGFTLDWKILKGIEGADGIERTAHITVAGAKFLRYAVEEGKGVLYYLNSTKLQSRTIFDLSDGGRKVDPSGSDDLYTLSATTTWLSYRLIGKNLYFISSNVNSYTYFVDTTKFRVRDPKSFSNELLSIMTKEDKIALMTEKKAEE